MSNMENPGAASTARGAENDVQASTPNEIKDITGSPQAQDFDAVRVEVGASVAQSRNHSGSQISAQAPHLSPVRKRLQCYRWDALNGLPRQRWIVKGVLPEGGLSLLVGQSGSRKSFLAIDIGASIARGTPWSGKKVNQGAVLYIAAEGGRGIVERFDAYAKYHNLSVACVPLFVLPESLDLRTPGFDVDTLICRIAELAADHNIHFLLIVVDTLNCVMAGGDENTPQDMGALLGNCTHLRTHTGSHVMMVHHLGKDPKKGARGHSSLKAKADTEILVTAKGISTTATISKQRDGVSGFSFSFHAEIVDLGNDADGDPITSCVLVPDNTTAAGQNSGGTPISLLSNAQRIAFEAFSVALKSDGISPPQGVVVPVGVACVVRIEQWRQQAYGRGIARAGVSDRARQQAFQRASKALESAGYIGTADDFVWLAPKH